MNVVVIQVPYMLGDERHPAARGASALVDAGLVTRLEAVGASVDVATVERGSSYADTATASRAVNRNLATHVGRAATAAHLPVVLAGSCDSAVGVVAGLNDPECGLIWLDAHGDFNTPETTLSGFFAGMSLAIVTGDCYRNWWSQITEATPISQESTLLIGVRDLDPAERERLAGSRIATVAWRDGRATSSVAATLNGFAGRVRTVYVHFDLDVLDPSVAPGIVDEPVPGGLTLSDIDDVMDHIARSFEVRALTVATYNPERDPGGGTGDAVVQIVERFAKRRAEVPSPSGRS